MFNLEDFISSIASREQGGLWGIGLAADTVKSIMRQSPESVLEGIATPDAWAKELSDAAKRLAYSDESMTIKGIDDSSSISPNSVLEYDAVLSSRRKDHDGDIVESAGLMVDQQMPLLWQHLQLQPIGKHVRVLSQTEDQLVCKFAIADTALGRDAATLTRFGALRKSQGFRPTEFAPLLVTKNAEGKDVVRGWHVKKALVFEGSLVSIPANADGRVLRYYEKAFDGLATAYSRGQLHEPMVKSWAKSLYDQRPVVLPGVSTVLKSGGSEIQWNPVANRWQDIATKRFVTAAQDVMETEQMTVKAASVKCPSCGTANDMSGVPDGMDLTKKKCSVCGKPLAAAEKSAGEVETKTAEAAVAPAESVTSPVTKSAEPVTKTDEQSPAPVTKSASEPTATPPVTTPAVPPVETPVVEKSIATPEPVAPPVVTKAGKVLSSANLARVKTAVSALEAILEEAGEPDEPDNSSTSLTDIANGVDTVLGKSSGAPLETKANPVDIVKLMGASGSDYLDGSYEWLIDSIRQPVQQYLMAKGMITNDYSCYPVATFADSVVCGCPNYMMDSSSPDRNKMFQVSYEMKDGKPVPTGDPKRVDVKQVLIEKAIDQIVTKNVSTSEIMEKAKASEPAPAPVVEPDTMLSLARKMAGMILNADGVGGEVSAANETIQKAIATLRQLVEDAEFEELEKSLS